MSYVQPQAIAGVTAESENQMMTKWPSIAAMPIGRFIGQLMASAPLRLILALPVLGPIAALLYLVQKVTGERYTITNKSVQRWSALGGRLIQRVELADIASMDLQQQSGQQFFRASDLLLRNAKGDVVMRLEGLPHAEIFRENIAKVRAATLQVQESLNTIKTRASA
jgi:hypothetical protein